MNEPGALVRNDLITPDPGPARDFYVAVFDFTLDSNPDLPEMDFTFLRRPTGTRSAASSAIRPRHVPRGTRRSRWPTRTPRSAAALAHGGKSDGASDMLYGRIATVLDPFGAEFSVITRAG